MARTDLSVQSVGHDGLNLTLVALTSADGGQFSNNNKQTIYANNPTAGAIVATIPTYGTVDGLAIEDPTVSVPAGAFRLIKAEPAKHFNNPATGKTEIDVDVDGLEVGVFE